MKSQSPNKNSEKKVIVITGASKGLGKAISDVFRVDGEIVVVADIDVWETKDAQNERNQQIKVDVTNEVEVSSLIETVVAKFGKIDLWINNAGLWLPPVSVENLNLEKAQKLFQVNFFGYLHGLKYAVAQMKKQGHGSVANIISTTAFDGMNGSSGSLYVSSKYALRGLTNTVRAELKDTNISVFGIYPGGMKTELFNESQPENFGEFMSVETVAQKIVENFKVEKPELDLILKRE